MAQGSCSVGVKKRSRNDSPDERTGPKTYGNGFQQPQRLREYGTAAILAGD